MLTDKVDHDRLHSAAERVEVPPVVAQQHACALLGKRVVAVGGRLLPLVLRNRRARVAGSAQLRRLRRRGQ